MTIWIKRMTLRQLLGVLVLLAGCGFQPAALAEDEVSLEFGGRSAVELRLPIGRSQIISSPVALEQVVIGSPEIADIRLLSAGRVLILGIKPGRTNLVFRQKGGDLVALMDVVVGYDVTGVRGKVSEMLPGETRLQIRDSNDRVILSGDVSSVHAMDMVLSVARSYVPAEKVINLLQVTGGSQVMLEARIAEVSRDSLKDLGIKTSMTDRGTEWNVTTGAGLAQPFGNVTWNQPLSGSFDSLRITLEALEKKGLAKTLAEPNLVALSGQEANFLAGGEIPIPVAQSGTVGGGISVEYKEFGVGLRFTPTVLDAGRINLKLLSEVSALGTVPYTIGAGINVPSITTRRAGTTVELADGQSFAIAGLMQSDMNNAVKRFPLLGSIPVLGVLFRSTSFQRNETELVVIVTARLVKPVFREKLESPTDGFVPPGSADQYLMGRLEGSRDDDEEGEEDGKAPEKKPEKPAAK